MYICISVGTPVCTHMHTYMHTHAGCFCMWRLKGSCWDQQPSFLDYSSTCISGGRVSVNPELADVFSLTRKLALKILCFYLLRLELQEGH